MKVSPEHVMRAVGRQDEAAIRQWLALDPTAPLDPATWPKGHARALEEEWTDGVMLLEACVQAHPESTPIKYRMRVLSDAAEEGWLNAVDRLLTDHPDLLSFNTPGSPLSTAIQAHQEPVVHRMLQSHVHPTLLDNALWDSVVENMEVLLPTLWPRTTARGKAGALARILEDSQEGSLAWVEAHLSASLDELREVGEHHQRKIDEILLEGTEQGRTGLVMRLLPLSPARATWLLCVAVEHQQGDLIDQLLPLSDPQKARKNWLRQKPPQWEHVDQLGLHLPPDQQKAWFNRPDQMPRMTATKRGAKSHETPPVAPTRRRLRS